MQSAKYKIQNAWGVFPVILYSVFCILHFKRGTKNMKYLSQFLILMGFTLAGEALQRLIPLPIPASVYGLALLFGALCLKVVKVEQVKDTGAFLTSILPILFVSPAVGIVEDWGLISDHLIPILLLLIGSTILSFGISGRITQAILKKVGENHD